MGVAGVHGFGEREGKAPVACAGFKDLERFRRPWVGVDVEVGDDCSGVVGVDLALSARRRG